MHTKAGGEFGRVQSLGMAKVSQVDALGVDEAGSGQLAVGELGEPHVRTVESRPREIGAVEVGLWGAGTRHTCDDVTTQGGRPTVVARDTHNTLHFSYGWHYALSRFSDDFVRSHYDVEAL